MADYELTKKANEDLDGIWGYTYEEWGETQADKYYFELVDCCQFLAENQNFGKNYKEIFETLFGYRINRHIIFYQRINSTKILIVRILHDAMDLKNRILE